MKHIKLFEQFINEGVDILKKYLPGVKFEEQEYEFDPEEGFKSIESYSFNIRGVDEPAYINIYDGDSFCFFYDSAPIGVSLHTSSERNEMSQSQSEIPKPLNKLNKKIYDEAVANIKEYVGESVTNEGNVTLGSKSKRFYAAVDDLVDSFVDAEKKEHGKLPTEYNNALKTLGINKQDAAVCFSDAVGDWETIIDAAKKAGIKYEEVDDKETGAKAIVFSVKQ